MSNGLLEKSVHDLKRAVGLLDHLDITLEGVKDDTFLAAYLLDPNRSKYDLAILRARPWASRVLINQQMAGPIHSGKPQSPPILLRALQGCCINVFSKRNLRQFTRRWNCRWRRFSIGWSARVLKVDRATLSDLSNYLGLEFKKLTIKIYELAGREFNIGSPKQVGDVLSELNMTSGRKTSTGRISTSKAVLEELAQTLRVAETDY